MVDEADQAPGEIERRSFAIIAEELAARGIVPGEAIAPVVMRVIHTTADFEYAASLLFSDGAPECGVAALRAGAAIVTDTRMALAGINRRNREALGVEAHCYIADGDVAERAAREGCTRSRVAVDKAAVVWPDGVYAVGNAPTALLRLCELVKEGRLAPRLVIGVPVGFVNVVESKRRLLDCGVPCIVAEGRKGGSTVAAAICNALLLLARG